VTCLLLVTTMGGNEYRWNSDMILSLIAAVLVLFVAFVLQERRASEPVLPPRLFANATFRVANWVNLLGSIGMLGGLIFLPLYLQLVHGLSAGDSGLMLIPLTGATVVGAIGSGRLIAETGRYKVFPVAGIVFNLIGLLLLSGLGPASSLVVTAGCMMLTGLGTGMIMPVMLVVVQNAVDHRDMGTATSSISFFRSMGGAFGVALFGAVLIGRLDTLIGGIPGHEILGADPGLALLHAGPDAISGSPAALRAAVSTAVTIAFRDMFHVAAGIAALALVSIWFLKELPLRSGRAPGQNPGDGGAMAGSASLAE
jgi:predicted MFS family arabinose efflux permease